MVGDRQDGAATAAPSDKKLGKITSTKVGSIYPTLTVGTDAGATPLLTAGPTSRTARCAIFSILASTRVPIHIECVCQCASGNAMRDTH